MSEFKDHFSKQSGLYSKYRPRYPDAMFRYLSEIAPSNKLAWDCATGSGQAALGLTPFFEKIIASDASTNQLEHAAQHHKIVYKHMPAEQTDLPNQSLDLITVAQAIHWFNFDRFYREVNRVLKPGGIIAVWTYNLPKIHPNADKVLYTFYRNTIHDFWPPERILVENNYIDLPFPFKKLKHPVYKMYAQWNVDDVVGFVNTWSAVIKYQEKMFSDPVPDFRFELEKAWPEKTESLKVEWPLTLLIGKK